MGCKEVCPGMGLALKETEEVDADEPVWGCSLTIFDGWSAARV